MGGAALAGQLRFAGNWTAPSVTLYGHPRAEAGSSPRTLPLHRTCGSASGGLQRIREAAVAVGEATQAEVTPVVGRARHAGGEVSPEPEVRQYPFASRPIRGLLARVFPAPAGCAALVC
jgi:hypothetical protein